jgi:hypothetical protein
LARYCTPIARNLLLTTDKRLKDKFWIIFKRITLKKLGAGDGNRNRTASLEAIKLKK